MRILHLIPYSPIPPTFGGALRNYHLLKHMAANHDVTVLLFGTPEDADSVAEGFHLPGDRVRVVRKSWIRTRWRLGQMYAMATPYSFFHLMIGRSGRMQEAIDEVLAAGEFDIVQTEFTPMGCYKLRTSAVKILDAHNVEYQNHLRMSVHANSLIRRLWYRRETYLLKREETRACRQHDAVFATSARDLELLEKLSPGVPKFVIPNGVDASYFKAADQTPASPSLVFTGMMAYVPNSDGMLYFLDEIFPLIKKKVPGVTITIVGNRPPRELLRRASDDVIVTGYVDDVRPFVERAAVYVAPLRIGSGTRLKILEALSMKKPVVTTSIGCEGLDVVDGESALVADEPEAFACRVIELLHSDRLRRKLMRTGSELVREKYDWRIVHKRLDEAYCEVLRSARIPAGADADRDRLEYREPAYVT